MNYSPGLRLVGRNIPQFLDSDTENLRATFLAQVEDPGQFLGQMAAGALGEKSVAGMEFHSRLIVRLVGTIARNAHVASGDAHDRSIIVEKHFRGSESGEDLNP